MSAKSIRKNGKEDKFTKDTTGIQAYATKYRGRVLGIVIGVLIIAGVIFGYFTIRKSKISNANARLGLVCIMLETGSYQEAADTLISLTENFKGTPAGKIAVYMLGHINFLAGKYDEAIQFYKDFMTNPVNDSDLIAASIMGIGACYEEKAQYIEAAKTYEELINRYPKFFRADEAYIAMARCHSAAGDDNKAIELYKNFFNKYPYSSLKKRTAVLLSRYGIRGMGG